MKIPTQNKFLIDYLRNNQIMAAIALKEINLVDLIGILNIAASDGINKKSVLLDVTNASYQSSELNRKALKNFLDSQQTLNKIAVVAKNDLKVVAESFSEYLGNSSIQYQVFENFSEAVSWL